MYKGDFRVGQTVVHKFNTEGPTGAPITVAGSPVVKVYKDGSTTTETTTGVTLTVDFDSVTGLHHVLVDTSSDGSFYSSGSDFVMVLTAGTVNAVSVAGKVLGHFSLENRSTLIASGIRSAVGLASANLDTQLSNISALVAASAIRAALGLASANLDTQLAAIAAFVDTEVATILSQTTAAAIRSALGMASANLDTQIAAILTTQMTESYAADGVAPTAAQALMLIQQRLTEFATSGVTITVKKLDGSTQAAVLTMDDATSPTASTRSA